MKRKSGKGKLPAAFQMSAKGYAFVAAKEAGLIQKTDGVYDMDAFDAFWLAFEKNVRTEVLKTHK